MLKQKYIEHKIGQPATPATRLTFEPLVTVPLGDLATWLTAHDLHLVSVSWPDGEGELVGEVEYVT